MTAHVDATGIQGVRNGARPGMTTANHCNQRHVRWWPGNEEDAVVRNQGDNSLDLKETRPKKKRRAEALLFRSVSFLSKETQSPTSL